MITLNLTVEEVNLLIGSLRELPMRVSEELVNKIKVQATQQLEPAPVVPVDVEVVEQK